MGSARVTSIDALKALRIAVADFRSEAGAALMETEGEIQRQLIWLRHEQLAHWQRQVRVRTELLTRARSDLYRKQVAQEAQVRAGVDQKKAVEAAKRALEEAEQKIVAVKHWIRLLDRELVLYKGEVQTLAGMLEGDLQQAEGRLEEMVRSLEAYAAIAAPVVGGGGGVEADAPVAPAEAGASALLGAQESTGTDVSRAGGPSDGPERRAQHAAGSDEEAPDQVGTGPA